MTSLPVLGGLEVAISLPTAGHSLCVSPSFAIVRLHSNASNAWSVYDVRELKEPKMSSVYLSKTTHGTQFAFHKTFENSIISLEFAGKSTLSLSYYTLWQTGCQSHDMVVWASVRCSCNCVCTYRNKKQLHETKATVIFLCCSKLAFVERAELLQKNQNKQSRPPPPNPGLDRGEC